MIINNRKPALMPAVIILNILVIPYMCLVY
jgi:hypothetical protein